MQKDTVLIMSITELQQSGNKVFHQFETPFFGQFNEGDIQDGLVTVGITTNTNFGYYSISLEVIGTVKVKCTRCNEPINFEVKCQETCRVVDGDEESDYDGELLLLHPKHKTVDLTNFLYETIALSLPIQIFHQEGQCVKN